jgi:hypothetical protein
LIVALFGLTGSVEAAQRKMSMRKIDAGRTAKLQGDYRWMMDTLAQEASTPGMAFVPGSVSRGRLIMQWGGSKDVPKAKIKGARGKVALSALMAFPTSAHDLKPRGFDQAVDGGNRLAKQRALRELATNIDKRVQRGQQHTLWLEVNGRMTKIGSVDTNSEWVVGADVKLELPQGKSRLHFDPIGRQSGSMGFPEGRILDFEVE